jgi:hypothetical protein
MKKLRRFVLGCLLAAILLPPGRAAAASPPIATVIALRGEVFREAGGNRQPLQLRDALRLDDTLVSEAGKAKLLLNDGSIVSLGEHSRLMLVHYQSVANGRSTLLRLFDGVIRIFVNRATAGGAFEIRTETAVAAVRGTDWLMEAVPGRTGVAIISGVVAVSGVGAEASAVVLLQHPGDGVDVAKDKPPEAVHRWAPKRFQSVLARASFD